MKSQNDNVPSYEEAMQNSATPVDQNPYSGLQGALQAPHDGMHLSPMPSAPSPQSTNLVQQIHVNAVAKCRSCNAPLHTRVGHVSTCCTHMSFLCCCIFGMFLCAPFLYCTKCCREPRVYCVNCGEQV